MDSCSSTTTWIVAGVLCVLFLIGSLGWLLVSWRKPSFLGFKQNEGNTKNVRFKGSTSNLSSISLISEGSHISRASKLSHASKISHKSNASLGSKTSRLSKGSRMSRGSQMSRIDEQFNQQILTDVDVHTY
ncbi:uncharacterized protein LOC111711892 [Eurytemora carolleeae]|uniref:uncharacterized protein LOC111711892 n=1 Tax=Eurytemora carolleeae TaxID=1294199 RepID=UPI000C78D211|nr:uncharacterized protein LOC111711892 [Eurytemora carolleeae]|eukprot:XP_023342116.1 uncharacterized protein LOC111711892 [Eurytemora affinis]